MQIGIPEIERKYEILELLGEGGMGSIYRARHRYLDELRVIKTIRPQLREDEELQARFLREAQVAAKLRHAHIASIFDFTMTDEGVACIVMEYIDGLNLREVQRSQRRLSVNEILAVATQVLAALTYLHDRQFVHRDISTDNLMLSWDGAGKPVAKLIDLGLAKSLESPQWQTRTGMVVGKVRYIAPEQLSQGVPGVVVDARCDLYSFGVVLHELFTDQMPITGDDDVSMIAGHLHRDPRSFSETDPRGRIPPALRAVVMRALAKKPDDRFTSAAAFSAALDRIDDEHGTVRVAESQAGPTAILPSAPIEAPTEALNSDELAAIGRRAVAAFGPGAGRRKLLRVVGLLGAVALLLAGGWWWRNRPAVPTTSDRTAVVSRAATAQGTNTADVFFGDNHALLIGINDYDRLPRLASAVPDVRALGSLLETRFGYAVEVLENPSRSAIINALSAVGQRLTARDNLLVYYAGHGTVNGMQEYWQPIDSEPDRTTNWISTRHEISSVLDQSAARHVLVISDSCYAGAVATGQPAPPAVPVGAERQDAVRTLAGRTSRMVMTSGGLSPVLDQGDGRHSIFARALLDALAKSSAVVAASEVFSVVQPQVREAAAAFDFQQVPTMAAIPRSGDEGGELFFVPAL